MKRMIAVAGLALMLVLAPHPAAQSAAKPRFDVASVKPSASDDPLPGGMRPTPGRFAMTNATLRFLIQRAYGPLIDFQIIGGPDWQTSRRFDIQATADSSLAGDAMLPMLRTLLEERFQLKVHTETREMPIFAVVVARPGNNDGRLGANIKPSTLDCSNPAQAPAAPFSELLQAGRVPCAVMPAPARLAGSAALRGNGASMTALAEFLTRLTGRMVHDRTGLSGLYDWDLTYDRAIRGAAPEPAPQAVSTSESPALATALQEQLGLKLESTRGPVEVLVIDSAALPGPD